MRPIHAPRGAALHDRVLFSVHTLMHRALSALEPHRVSATRFIYNAPLSSVSCIFFLSAGGAGACVGARQRRPLRRRRQQVTRRVTAGGDAAHRHARQRAAAGGVQLFAPGGGGAAVRRPPSPLRVFVLPPCLWNSSWNSSREFPKCSGISSVFETFRRMRSAPEDQFATSFTCASARRFCSRRPSRVKQPASHY